jgi:hypothetical protein
MALAQGGTCVTHQLLRVDAAFARIGTGGTFDYSVQISNISPRAVTFRVAFRMSNVHVNPQLLGRAFTLPPHGSGMIVVGNGLDQAMSTRIRGGVVLTC